MIRRIGDALQGLISNWPTLTICGSFYGAPEILNEQTCMHLGHAPEQLKSPFSCNSHFIPYIFLIY